MSTIQTIIAGGGAQAVSVYATDAQGRVAVPTSPGTTGRIVDLTIAEGATGREILAETAATIDSTATTTTAAAGPREVDPTKIVVTSASGFVVGSRYLLSDGGLTEAFEVVRVDATGLALYARDKLRSRFASGAAVQGCRVSVTFPGATADDADELERRALFGVDWTFAGVTGPSPVRTLCRIERRGKPLRATVDDLLLLDPSLATSTHSRTVLESHLRQADRELDALLLHRGDVLADTTQGELGRVAVCWRALALAYFVLGPTYEDRSTKAQREADRWHKAVLSGASRDDAVEVERSTDRQRPRRTRIGIGLL